MEDGVPEDPSSPRSVESMSVGLLEDGERQDSQTQKLYVFLFCGAVALQGALVIALWCGRSTDFKQFGFNVLCSNSLY